MNKTRALVAVAMSTAGLFFGGILPTSLAVAATGTWTTPFGLASGVAGMYDRQASIEFDSEGNAIVIWSLDNGINRIVGTRSSRDGGATWEEVTDLSAAGQDAENPRIGVDGAGNAIAIWSRSDGSDNVIQSRSSNDGGATWNPVVNLSTAGQNAWDPQIDFDAAGNAIAVWQRWNGSHAIVQTSTSTNAGATWGAVTDLSAAGADSTGQKVRFDASGDAIAVWQRYSGGEMAVQTRSSNDAGATWGAVTDLSVAGQSGYYPQISVDAGGNAIAIWQRFDGNHWIAQTRSSSDGGATWGAVTDLSAAGSDAAEAQIGFDSVGRAIAVWHHYDGVRFIVQTRSSSNAGATWGAMTELSPAGEASYDPDISFDRDGNAIAFWVGRDGANYVVQYRSSSDGGANWNTAETSYESELYPSDSEISFDSEGNAIAVWSIYADNFYTLQTSVFDAPARATAALAATGGDTSVTSASAVVGAGLLVAGVLALAVARRRSIRG